ncbi:division/cell wall cluster transcriptional repressor MraZ, partial [Fibrobacterota bacterium]
KGRTNLPRELRKQLPAEAGGKVIVSIFADRSLALRPVQEWNRYVTEDLEPLARRNRKGANFVMMATSMAKLSELDAQNRITLSADLMKYAGIERDVTFAGDGARIRLWNPDAYAKMIRFAEEDAEGFEDCFYQNNRDS